MNLRLEGKRFVIVLLNYRVFIKYCFFEDFKIYIFLILGESVFVLAFRGFPSVSVCLRRARLHSSKLRNRHFEIVNWILNLYFCQALKILGFR